ALEWRSALDSLEVLLGDAEGCGVDVVAVPELEEIQGRVLHLRVVGERALEAVPTGHLARDLGAPGRYHRGSGDYQDYTEARARQRGEAAGSGEHDGGKH